MVEMRECVINNQHFMVVCMSLPKCTIRCIYSTKGILFDQSFNFETLTHFIEIPFCIGNGHSVEELLSNQLIYISDASKRKGICNTSKGMEALLRMSDES